jgi:hypothetical protein
MAKQGKRFPLLIYAHLWRRWGCLGALLMVTSGALWLVAPRLSITDPMRYLALFPVLVGGILLLYGYAARNMAHVRCLRTCLRIQGPIYPLFVSYSRIAGTRPAQIGKILDPQRDKAARRAWPLRYWSMTAVVLDLKGFPINEWWLRLWFNRYLFHPTDTALLLLVEDWMSFSQQLDSFTSAYRTRHFQ